MPVSVEFENDGIGVVMSAYGVVGGSDFFIANRQLYVPAVMEKLRYQIVDLHGVENVDANWESIKQLAEADKNAAQTIPGLKIAIVAKPGILEGLAQVYERLAADDSLKTHVFHNMTAARQWVSDCMVMEKSA
jgi:hypothetical protein